jgi:hypothetical protein
VIGQCPVEAVRKEEKHAARDNPFANGSNS